MVNLSDPGQLKFLQLRDQPGYLLPLAKWHQRQWHHLNPGETLEGRIARMQAYLDDNFLPSMFIAIQDETLLGSAAIVQHDMDTHPEYSPWLASVYIHEPYRHHGLGRALVEYATCEAFKQNISRLFLFTPDRADFYKYLGWQEFSHETYHDESVVLMSKTKNN